MVISSRARSVRRRCTGNAGGGAEAGADSGNQAVLTAVAGVRPEVDRLVLPGGIERREVGRIGVRLGEQRRYVFGFGLRGRERRKTAENGLVVRLALAQAFGQSCENMGGLSEQLVRLGARPRREELQEQRHEI